MASTYFPASVAEGFELGTTIDELGGIGLGYRAPCGSVVESGGNGFYYPVHRLRSFEADGGEGYRRAVRSLGLGRFLGDS